MGVRTGSWGGFLGAWVVPNDGEDVFGCGSGGGVVVEVAVVAA